MTPTAILRAVQRALAKAAMRRPVREHGREAAAGRHE